MPPLPANFAFPTQANGSTREEALSTGTAASTEQATACNAASPAPHQDAQLLRLEKSELESWEFSAFDLDKRTGGRPLITVTMALLEAQELLDGWKVDRPTVERFLARVESEYLPNPYHNNIHAADVTQTAAVIMQSLATQLHDISKLDRFCVIIACSVHDLGHLGVNNDFLINAKHSRATTYNDQSVNESFHISRAFEVMRTSPGCDIFSGLSTDEAKQCRKLMIDTVMATDMARHFALLEMWKGRLASTPDLNAWDDHSLVYQMVVHLADIGNPSRPFHLARGWAERVIEEFCFQGDQEVEQGLPLSPMCKRETMNMPKAQQGFIEVFLRPTLASFENVAPEFTKMAMAHLDTTVSTWKALEEQGFKM